MDRAKRLLPPSEHDECKVMPNTQFQEWVKQTCNTDIPKTALNIVKIPAQYGDENPDDEFCRWVYQYMDY